MKALLSVIILAATLSVEANECVNYYRERIETLSEKHPSIEAIQAYCGGEPSFIALSGIEYLVLEVPEYWLNQSINIKELFYMDGIECDEQRQHLELEEKYARTFNIQMVKCLNSYNSCCQNETP